jgi:plasmid maintenance system antidote protein VapI
MIIEIIRKELRKSKISRHQIAKDTGVDEAALSRIYHEEMSCVADTADKLLKYFGYKVVKVRKKRGAK